MDRQLQSDRKRMIMIWNLIKKDVKKYPDIPLINIRDNIVRKRVLVYCPICRTCERCVKINFRSLCDRFNKYKNLSYSDKPKGMMQLINAILKNCTRRAEGEGNV